MQPTPSREVCGEFAKFRGVPSCEWSKPTVQGSVIEGLVTWADDPAVEGWLHGIAMPGIDKNARIARLLDWCQALAAEIKRNPVVSRDRENEFFIDGLRMTLRDEFIEISMALPGPSFSGDVLLYWQRQANTAVRLASVELDPPRVSVKVPFVTPRAADVEAILDAIRYLQKEVSLILAVFGLHPDVACVWQRWVGAMLGEAKGGE